MNALYLLLLDLFFPKQCSQCQKMQGLYICSKCKNKLDLVTRQICIVCQKSSEKGFTHKLCTTKYTPDRLIGIFSYKNELVSKLINNAKLSLVSDIFTELSLTATEKIEIENFDFMNFVLCPIPVTKFKKRFRGFNQSELITKVFAEQFDLPIDNILIKTRSTKQQKHLNKEQRNNNLQDSFKINLPQSLPNKVILVDDVCTTGSTFLEASKILRKSGIATVWCLALSQD